MAGRWTEAPTVRLFETTLHNLSRSETCDAIEAMVAAHDRCYLVCVKDVALTMRSRRDPFLRAFYETPDLTVVDGRGLVLASRLLGRPLVEMVSGPLMYLEMIRRAEAKGLRVYVLGATSEIVEAAAARLRATAPRLQLAGYHHGYLDPGMAEKVVEEIQRTAPDLVFIGMPTPLREQFIAKYRAVFPPCVCIPVGGVLDVSAGTVHLAPTWLNKAGGEWLYRVAQEPRRLFGRYARSHAQFAALLFAAVLRRAWPWGRGTSGGS